MSELYWLILTASVTAVMWLPYVLERILRVGLGGALGYAPLSGTAGFEQAEETPPQWARRASAAHRNAVENLPVFAALVLSAHLLGVTGGLIATLAMVHFFARIGFYLVYVAGIPVLRTLAFFASWASMIWIAVVLLQGI